MHVPAAMGKQIGGADSSRAQEGIGSIMLVDKGLESFVTRVQSIQTVADGHRQLGQQMPTSGRQGILERFTRSTVA